MVAIPAWGGVRLRSAAAWQDGVTQVGIRANYIRPAAPDAVNAIPCRVERVVEDVFTTIVLLRPEGSLPGAPLLRMELPKDLWTGADALSVAATPEHILLLQ